MSKRTVENLKTAFAGESQARNKYTFFAQVARKEGWLEVAEAFETAALNEEAHAKVILKLLEGIGDTKANLQAAIEGETYEHESMYPEFLKVAEEEGEDAAAQYFRTVIEVEKDHAKMFADLKKRLENGELLKSKENIKWKCRVCGYIHEGTTPPEVCPLCFHPAKHYKPYKG
ncbi:rubrerythrin [Anoxybacter fermentans]|uniref:Rubrerythrin n=1 Tax=Anoxybacter fermentans TaxID=1323375 RepID=A0A3S9T0S6_9FIRM|nr:rubrerythrin family protein [Anoxybacter fermentans]AZR74161.1 rubrerythrin [Anoxybacter fermentans]